MIFQKQNSQGISLLKHLFLVNLIKVIFTLALA